MQTDIGEGTSMSLPRVRRAGNTRFVTFSFSMKVV
jgi:hypothetical protein